ncbi:glutathione S-transferase family protein [Paraburkholderia sp. UYCP14C]|uniref:glutathione S-transferase family protein n=1 Tax=Paraburkholderia sp. UYCP14C TaxID=2511130 RepID=UPI001021B149|nr:glutathione S-transferase family protein [Paraburkholderia sp. UYCP14C]RZF27306.1 glutathione S-transferase family protein [Paraburkholderia sp. UYCP14C]
MNTTYELVGAPTGNCIRAAIALEEARLPYEVRLVNLAAGEQMAPSHLALNPAGKVPVLVEREADQQPLILTQSNAIVFYVAEKSPGSLLPMNVRARAAAYERFFFFLTEVIAPGHAAFSLKCVGARDAQALLTESMLAALATAERYLDRHAYMAGDAFSIADIAAFTITRSVYADLPWRTLPTLQRWYEVVEARPAVLRGLQAFDIAPTAR